MAREWIGAARKEGLRMFSVSDEGEPLRLPGLFRGWELPQILESGAVYRIEEVGRTTEGSTLFAVWAGSTPVTGKTGA